MFIFAKILQFLYSLIPSPHIFSVHTPLSPKEASHKHREIKGKFERRNCPLF